MPESIAVIDSLTAGSFARLLDAARQKAIIGKTNK